MPRSWRLAGRLVAKRGFGKTVFAPIRDGTGDLQLYLSVEHCAPTTSPRCCPSSTSATSSAPRARCSGPSAASCRCWSPRLVLLTKSLRPLPDKWHGLTDVEAALPPALRRPRGQPRRPRGVRQALEASCAASASSSTPRLPRGRDADDAPDHRRRRGAAVRHPPQRARHEAVHAHRARALPQAPGGRRVRARLRDQPQLPQRGAVARHNPEFTMLEFYWAYAPHRSDGPDRGADRRPGARRCAAAPPTHLGRNVDLDAGPAVAADHGPATRWLPARRAVGRRGGAVHRSGRRGGACLAHGVPAADSGAGCCIGRRPTSPSTPASSTRR
jgi:hypothetical protein